jgi:hypothetical protein
MTISTVAKLALTAACVCVTHSASAIVIDFEEFAQPQELWGAGNKVSSKGFTFAYTAAPGEPYPVGFHFVGTSWRFNAGGSIALVANSCSASTVLQSDSNTPFTLNAIELGELNGPGQVTNVVFQATTATGQVVSYAVNIDGQSGVQRISFPQYFNNLTSVKWLQGDCLISPPYLIDNVVINDILINVPSTPTDNVVINDIVTNAPSTPTRPGNAYGHDKNGTPPYGNAYGYDKDQKPHGNIYSNPFGRK